MSNSPLYYAKILLFGEYGIISNSNALSIPFSSFYGSFGFITKGAETPEQIESNRHLAEYAKYLQTLEINDEFFTKFDFERLNRHIIEGLYFNSSIPQGFGVGSSGALVAAVYDTYAINKIDPDTTLSQENLPLLKKQLAIMESYFHGKSSGMDPLICYLKIPVLLSSSNNLNPIQLPESGNSSAAIFLINSGVPGKTQSMVSIFMEKMKNEGFRRLLKNQFIKYNDACIDAFLKGEIKVFFKNLKKLSSWVLTHFTPMIPENLVELWEKGLATNEYYLKLCGSGGGGFVLGFAPDYEKAYKTLSPYNPQIIFRL
ncbi:mevalonate kinase [Thermaurantimonas aggregans]|uniref:Mevalonate kinase n=1 Tax=Thermaurantimonas aggregans TaxID=2173829 RepID=A0A401XN71_9FLAO|nr:mevalonate kinase [Thermaurantimonas aggregans]MCX8149599.1 mevalonate kinase [Thermaurantimonas aggregans]GCD78423.1 mevalonate kinase [Thermaurantimonas aggregans]